jgi:oligoendopeptidase F
MEHHYPNVNAREWDSIHPHIEALLAAELTPENVRAWLQQWSDLESVLDEEVARIYRAITENTADEEADARFKKIVQEVFPHWQKAEHQLKEKWGSLVDYQPDEETEQVYRRFRAEINLFKDENIPIITELELRSKRYQEIIGGLSIEWKGEQLTIPQAEALLSERDRSVRERAWREMMNAYLAPRQELNDLFLDLLSKRRQLAANANYSNYRDYAWIERGRFDYTPDDCLTFHDAIEQEVVPLATDIYHTLARQIGVETLRPWETGVGSPWLPTVDPNPEPLHPFSDVAELEEAGQRVFTQVHPDFGGYFQSMRDGFLDLGSRPNKAPGGYMNSFPISGRAYIFMNAVGTHRNFRTLMHEGGHAFHFFEAFQHQSLIWNYHSPMEFSEVASMSL